jgi:hypothetical protein
MVKINGGVLLLKMAPQEVEDHVEWPIHISFPGID